MFRSFTYRTLDQAATDTAGQIDAVEGQIDAVDAAGQNDAAADEKAANEMHRDTLTGTLRALTGGKDYAAEKAIDDIIVMVGKMMTARWKVSERRPDELIQQFLKIDEAVLMREIVRPAVARITALQFALTSKHQSPLKGGRKPRQLVLRYVDSTLMPSSTSGKKSDLKSDIAAAL